MGAYMQITPALKVSTWLSGTVRGCYFGKLGQVDHKTDRFRENGHCVFECAVDLSRRRARRSGLTPMHRSTPCSAVARLDRAPVQRPDAHDVRDQPSAPSKPGGHLLITTPNLGSLRAIAAILQGYHPSFFPAYIKPRREGEEAEARHNREYVPMEIQHLLTDSGFEVLRLETGEFLDEPHPEYGWIGHLLEHYHVHETLRGDGIYALGRKTGAVKERWPAWLYQ